MIAPLPDLLIEPVVRAALAEGDCEVAFVREGAGDWDVGAADIVHAGRHVDRPDQIADHVGRGDGFRAR